MWRCELVGVIKIVDDGLMFGYYPKASKSSTIVKPEILDETKVLFTGKHVNIIRHMDISI